MRNLLALAALALITFAIVGWYLGWYQLQTEPAGNGHREVTIDINGPKIRQDLNKGKSQLSNVMSSKSSSTPAQPSAGSSARQSSATPPPGPPQAVQGTASWERPSDSTTLVIPSPDNGVPPGPSLPPPQ
jgi:hypothetical protein